VVQGWALVVVRVKGFPLAGGEGRGWGAGGRGRGAWERGLVMGLVGSGLGVGVRVWEVRVLEGRGWVVRGLVGRGWVVKGWEGRGTLQGRGVGVRGLGGRVRVWVGRGLGERVGVWVVEREGVGRG
jgi:hypothetical protein